MTEKVNFIMPFVEYVSELCSFIYVVEERKEDTGINENETLYWKTEVNKTMPIYRTSAYINNN